MNILLALMLVAPHSSANPTLARQHSGAPVRPPVSVSLHLIAMDAYASPEIRRQVQLVRNITVQLPELPLDSCLTRFEWLHHLIQGAAPPVLASAVKGLSGEDHIRWRDLNYDLRVFSVLEDVANQPRADYNGTIETLINLARATGHAARMDALQSIKRTTLNGSSGRARRVANRFEELAMDPDFFWEADVLREAAEQIRRH